MMGISVRVVMGPVRGVMCRGMRDTGGEAERSKEKQRAVGHRQAKRAELPPKRTQRFAAASKGMRPHGCFSVSLIATRVLHKTVYHSRFGPTMQIYVNNLHSGTSRNKFEGLVGDQFYNCFFMTYAGGKNFSSIERKLIRSGKLFF